MVYADGYWQSRVETQSLLHTLIKSLKTRKLMLILFRGGTITEGLQCRTMITMGITISQRVWINGRVH